MQLITSSLISGCLLIWLALGTFAAPSSFVTNGKSDYRIAISKEASLSEKYAAEELQKFLEQISGAKLPIVTDDQPIQQREIMLGDSKHLSTLVSKYKSPIDFKKLGDEGFTIRTVGNHLVIAGGRQRGTMYGTYEFLEKYLGCRWYTATVSHIPKQSTITLPAIDDTQVPAFFYREVLDKAAFDGDWSARNKNNGYKARLRLEQGGKFPMAYPEIHTFNWLMQGVDFKEKPELFGWMNGKPFGMEPNLTNPETLKHVIARVKQWMRDTPDAVYYNLSQVDGNYHDQSPETAAIDAREGSPMGSILNFTNQIADAVKDEFPNKRLITYAYAYSQKPPKTIKPRPNVWIQYCLFVWPVHEDLLEWHKITDRLMVWDYNTSYTHFWVPFPNLYVQKSMKQSYEDQYGVKGVFSQANYQDIGEFSELRTYLIAKLHWNPDADVDAIIDDFVGGYYGKAAPYIRQYINHIHASTLLTNDLVSSKLGEAPEIGAGKGTAASIATGWDVPFPADYKGWWMALNPDVFLNPGQVRMYDRLFEAAKKAVADDPEMLLRVRIAHMPVQFVIIEKFPVDDYRGKAAIEFFKTVDDAKITRHSEFGAPMEDYRTRIMGPRK